MILHDFSQKPFLPNSSLKKNLIFFPKEFQKIVIVYLSQTLIDFQNLSLFRKLMKILIHPKCGHTVTQPLSLVPPPLKILFTFIAFYLLGLILLSYLSYDFIL